jgi:hypothetical protein
VLACRSAKDAPRPLFYTVGGVVTPYEHEWILLAANRGIAVSAFDFWHVSMSNWNTRVADARVRVENGAWQSEDDLGVK